MELHEYTEEEKNAFRDQPGVLLELRKTAERAITMVFPLLIKGSQTQVQTAAYMKEQMIQKINNDELANKLIPDFALGCRRLTVSGPISLDNTSG